jgi:hypothetical protein
VSVRSAVLLSLLFGALAPHLAAQRINLPYKLSELEQRAQRDSNDAAIQYMLALGYWNAKPWDDARRYIIMLH